MNEDKKWSADVAELVRVINSRPLTGELVVGIDPSLSGTGLAVLALDADGEVVAAGATTIKIPTGLDQIDRPLKIMNGVENWVSSCGKNLSAIFIEDLPKHAHSAGLTGQAQGVVRAGISLAEDIAEHRVSVFSVAPATLKKAVTGNGRADKNQVAQAVVEKIRNLYTPTDDNQADALALALLARDHIHGRQEFAHSLIRTV